jgi:ABC-type lipoprotein release transport system permease subunit
MQSTLYEVGAVDFPTFGAITFLLLLAATVACLIPALRASKEPIVALRYE